MTSVNRASSSNLNGVSIPNALLETMCSGNDLINFCHLNVSSVKPKIDELRNVFRNTNAHVIFPFVRLGLKVITQIDRSN